MCEKTQTNKEQKTRLLPGSPLRKLARFSSRVFALIRQIPAFGSSRKRRSWLSSALAYKFIRKLSQFKCPRCFNQGASPFAPHSRINNSRISFPSFRLSSALFASPPTAVPSVLPSFNRDINFGGFSRVGVSNIKQPRFHSATSLTDEGPRGEGKQALLKNFGTASELVWTCDPCPAGPVFHVSRNYICSLTSVPPSRATFFEFPWEMELSRTGPALGGSPKLNLPRLIFFDNAIKIRGYGTLTQVDILKV